MKRKIPAIAIFDIGKTNKKLLVFDENYRLVRETTAVFTEIEDDDGFACEDLQAISTWVLEQVPVLENDERYDIKAINFSTYGASLVYIDTAGIPTGPLYNYLKPYDEQTWHSFKEQKGTDGEFFETTSTPMMGHLNAGMQLYWVKHNKPQLFNSSSSVLHLPQYLSFLLTGKRIAEMTSLGCHSAMWDFHRMRYHAWLSEQGIIEKLAPVTPGSQVFSPKDSRFAQGLVVGTGLHDSSAALIPYLRCFTDSFVILSTGTWSISLNPFNQSLPTVFELEKGCLNYLSCQGNPVKTSMLFSGNDHDRQVARIATHFNMALDFYKEVRPDREIVLKLLEKVEQEPAIYLQDKASCATTPCFFHKRSLEPFHTATEAYHQLVKDIVDQQKIATQMVLGNGRVQQLFVDGGFCKNELYMQMIATALPNMKVYATSMTQGTALGAALAIHEQWNTLQVSSSLVQLKRYLPSRPDKIERISTTQDKEL